MIFEVTMLGDEMSVMMLGDDMTIMTFEVGGMGVLKIDLLRLYRHLISIR